MATTTISPAAGGITLSGQSVVLNLSISVASGGITLSSGGVPTIMPIIADPIDAVTRPSRFATVVISGNILNPANNVTIFCNASHTDLVPEVVASLTGYLPSNTLMSDAIDSVASILGHYVISNPLTGTPIDAVAGLTGRFYSIAPRKNWVAWSKIGSMNFVADRTNEAGSRPMEWQGWAWRVMKLTDFVVVYGDRGICVMYPVSQPAATFGFKTIGTVGIASPWSLAGNELIHYFISAKGDLWRFTKKGPEKLGFSEFLSTLTNPVLVYDDLNDRLFISDGTTGFTYDGGLGGGYATLTGISDDYAVSPSDLTPVPFSLMTDTIDLGHRGIKTITAIEVGASSTEAMYAALDFRYRKDEDWRTSEWKLLNNEGFAKILVAAVEFRIRLKQTTFEETQIDYINLRHQRSDRRYVRGPLFELPDQGESG